MSSLLVGDLPWVDFDWGYLLAWPALCLIHNMFAVVVAAVAGELLMRKERGMGPNMIVSFFAGSVVYVLQAGLRGAVAFTEMFFTFWGCCAVAVTVAAGIVTHFHSRQPDVVSF